MAEQTPNSRSLWFVVPCFGRFELTRICLRALRWTCDQLAAAGVKADGVIVADDANLETARELGFGLIRRDNAKLSVRVNDGIAFAGWTRHAPSVARVEHVIYLGSDNWLHPDWVLAAFDRSALLRLVCMRREIIVAPDGARSLLIDVDYDGGQGVRLTPLELLRPLSYRPADEMRPRGIDGSTLDRLRRHYRGEFALKLRYLDLDARHLIGFQSADRQLTSYDKLAESFGVAETDGLPELADLYPAELVDAVAAHYRRQRSGKRRVAA